MTPSMVAMVGLGAMGLPMASRLADAGVELVIPRRAGRTNDAIGRLGARAVDSPAEAAARADVVITMLPDTPDVRVVATGRDGILDGGREGLLWIDMSTISPVGARELAALARGRGIRALDAPVSGGTRGAADGTLSIMVGGSEEDLRAAESLFSHLASRVVHVGPSGAGQVAKAANQIIVGGTIALVAEALTLAARLGCDPAVVREALLGGFADSRILAVHGERMLARDFAQGFRARLQRKDLAIALDAAHSCDLALSVAAGVHELFHVLCANGGAELDHSSLILAVELLAGQAGETTKDLASRAPESV